jgi:hypothetical protein
MSWDRDDSWSNGGGSQNQQGGSQNQGNQGGQQGNSWDERAAALRADLADWESTGGSRETWFEDQGLGNYWHDRRIGIRYNETY